MKISLRILVGASAFGLYGLCVWKVHSLDALAGREFPPAWIMALPVTVWIWIMCAALFKFLRWIVTGRDFFS